MRLTLVCRAASIVLSSFALAQAPAGPKPETELVRIIQMFLGKTFSNDWTSRRQDFHHEPPYLRNESSPFGEAAVARCPRAIRATAIPVSWMFVTPWSQDKSIAKTSAKDGLMTGRT